MHDAMQMSNAVAEFTNTVASASAVPMENRKDLVNPLDMVAHGSDEEVEKAIESATSSFSGSGSKSAWNSDSNAARGVN